MINIKRKQQIQTSKKAIRSHHIVRVRSFLRCTVWTSLLAGGIAQAQQTTATPSPSSTAQVKIPAADKNSGISEIVVTAEKRESTVQRTPLSITAVLGEALRAQGINDIGGVINAVPGISIRSAGPGQTELEIRGLSSSGGSAPTVGFYLNEIPLTPPSNSLNGKVVIDPSLFDLQRVEVLRGPQGTLYGSGSMGGTIKLITNAPNLEDLSGAVSGTVSTTAHGGFNSSINAAFNVPIIKDMLAVRAVVTNNSDSGFIDRIVVSPFPQAVGPCPEWNAFFGGSVGCVRGNLAGATPTKIIPKANPEHLQSARLGILWKPVEGLSLDGLLMYQSIKTDGYSQIDLPTVGSNKLSLYQPNDVREPVSDIFKLASLTATYDFSFATLKATGSYWTRTTDQSQDASEALENNTQALLGLTTPPPFYPVLYQEVDRSRQFSSEVRLASRGSGRLNWIAGVFYSYEKSVYDVTNESVAIVTNAAINLNTPATLTNNPTGIIFNAFNPYRVKQYAAFGEAGYQVTDTIKATVGIRWYKFKTNVDERQSGLLATGDATPVITQFSQSESGVNPKFNLSYQPDKSLTVYATAAKGFRPGGINLPIPQNLGCGITKENYISDSIWNYEVGEKLRLFNGAAQINASLFYIDWKNVQQSINQSCGYPLTVNAGKARSYGSELEITAKLSDALTISVSGAYTNSKLSNVDPSIVAVTASQPISLQNGSPVLNTPNFTSSASITYRTPINDSLDFVATGSNSYVGKLNDISYRRIIVPNHDIVNFRLGVEHKPWSVFAFVDNVTNVHAILSTNNTSFAWVVPSAVRGSVNRPRTIGLTIASKF